MTGVIGIRREDKNQWERRVPLSPKHVGGLVRKGMTVLVQPSSIRVFPDSAYAEAGAIIQEDLSPCRAIFGVKEIPTSQLQPGKVYVFFSHTIKGQAYNMPMLGQLMRQGSTLIDYERIVDAQGKRLIFFGLHAGYAGMIDTLHAFGLRLSAEKIQTPFTQVPMAHRYGDLAQAMNHLTRLGEIISKDGLPPEITPLITGFSGYGNVSQGAQQVYDCLPTRELSPEELLTIDLKSLSTHEVYKVVFREEHMAEPAIPGLPFDLAHYYREPDKYQGVFSRYLPKLSILMNCIYWEPRFPRLISLTDIQNLWSQATPPRLRVIGDISCDINGAVECTTKATEPDNPMYVFLPDQGREEDGVFGDGPVIMAVDNLPCELSGEASQFFSEGLFPFVEAIACVDPGASLEHVRLPPELMKALIAHGGQLTPPYHYIAQFL